MGDEQNRLIPDCRVSVGGAKLDIDGDAALTRVIVDLDLDLFGQCTLVFNDPKLTFINGKKFEAGTAIKVEIGFAAKLTKVFEGEVVALEPMFRRDQPATLKVVCQESLHRLALSTMTRSFNDVDDKEIANKIAQEHGLTADAPAGTKEHILQANVTDAAFLRRLAQQNGNSLRIEGKKIVVGPPPKGADIAVSPGAGLTKIKVKINSKQQIGEVTVHGWDPKAKQEIVGKAQPQGETGEGARKFGSGDTISVAGHGSKVPADVATAEAMAKGRMQKLSEGFVVAQGSMIGDPRVVPGAMLQLDKISNGVDGGFRVDRALHEFSRHGYRIDFKATRVTKKTASQAAARQQQQQQRQQNQQQQQENDKAQQQEARSNAGKTDTNAQAQALKDASKNGAPLCEECEKARKDGAKAA